MIYGRAALLGNTGMHEQAHAIQVADSTLNEQGLISVRIDIRDTQYLATYMHSGNSHHELLMMMSNLDLLGVIGSWVAKKTSRRPRFSFRGVNDWKCRLYCIVQLAGPLGSLRV
jgi:hypothetical protein